MLETDGKVTVTLAAAPDKQIPKLCNQVVFSIGTDGKIVLTFVYRESQGVAGIIIERVMLSDNKQADEIIEKLKDTIEKSNKIIVDKK